MTLLEYMKQLETKTDVSDLASKCGTSVGQLKQVAYGHRRASASLAIDLDRETGGVVACEETRPDIDWAYLRGRQRAA
ncbi:MULTISPECIES: transcriptional regulator [Pseudomonas]|uniref:transcriptional regulator n=2 Tax=Pseudomonas TaxID=286 RepID=UPI00053D90CD|nr:MULTISPECIES: YdaS family helix-turn-helix protein [Pseudomonas]HBO8763220.1 helix-turn-helix domain-containing protein [Pseudomonas aeruginosa]HCL3851044.1 helix-turn-helix domain-containing protein [Pseudomonas aeruginosa]HDY6177055.1 helix-turn-helix domain-containing protein [Pseudomonas aeruginosa]HDY6860440.1 helix-turn-helix domain-containing protein [Pseudomonas aeruginosa]